MRVAHVGQVVAHIESGAELVEPDWWEYSTIEGSPKTCSLVREKTVKEPKGRKLYPREGEEGLDQLAYESSITSYGPAEGTEPNKDGVIELNDDNLVEHVQKVRQAPNVALKVPDGWLAGTDRGEWGGELVHIPAQGDINVLAAERPELATASLDDDDETRPKIQPAADDPSFGELVLKDRLQKAIEQLPVPYQVLINGHYLKGMKYEDLAEALNMPMGTVKTHLHRAKRRLRHLLETEYR